MSTVGDAPHAVAFMVKRGGARFRESRRLGVPALSAARRRAEPAAGLCGVPSRRPGRRLRVRRRTLALIVGTARSRSGRVAATDGTRSGLAPGASPPRPTSPLDLAQPARLEVEDGVHDLRLACSSRTGRSARPARRAAGPRAAGTARRRARPRAPTASRIARVRGCRAGRRSTCGRRSPDPHAALEHVDERVVPGRERLHDARARLRASSPGRRSACACRSPPGRPSASPAITRTCARPSGVAASGIRADGTSW